MRSFQIGKGLPEISFTMRFKGDNRMQIRIFKEGEESCKIKIPASRRQVFIAPAGIVMQVQLTEPGEHCLQLNEE